MSGYLAGKVWRSALEGELKPLSAALADIANDDGTSIYPSVAYICWLLDRSERAVQGWLADLVRRGILKVISHGGGRAKTTEYHLIEDALPKRKPWRNPAIAAARAETETPQPLPQSPQSVPDTPQTEALNPAAAAPDTSLPEKQPSEEIQPCRFCGSTEKHTCQRSYPQKQSREHRPKWRREEKSRYREIVQAVPLPDFDPEGFASFWRAYPVKVYEDSARNAWNQVQPAVEEVLAGVARWRKTSRWRKDGGQYIPNPETFLLKKSWHDDPTPDIERGLNSREELQKKNREVLERSSKRRHRGVSDNVRDALQL